MNLGRLGRGEFLAVLGGLLLALGLFLPWYGTNPDNRNANIDGVRGNVSGWEAHPVLHWFLLAAALAPLILAWVIVRDHQLSWPRGEMTAVVGMIALVLVLYVGLVDRPGTPSSQISLKFGWIVALFGCAAMIVGGALRASGTERPRKPPGVL
jgi:4-amino-4-deoxy-L-arabinose transferase-like glycosyltransferase